MSDLICDNHSLLMVMSRFGLSLGFGDTTVEAVCAAGGVDCDTFLAVANFIGEREFSYDENGSTLAIKPLMEYLKSAHNYFLDFCLPMLRRKLIEAIDFNADKDIVLLILQFYDNYVEEVRRHMEYENKSVFTYVDALLRGERQPGYRIKVFSEKHNQIDVKLRDLKNIIIKYYPGGDGYLLNAVLFDIVNCEQDLASHCQVEDYLFVPAVEALERRLGNE